jgi:allantoinase
VRSLALAGERVALPSGIAPATVIVRDGCIAAILALGDRPGDAVDLGDAVLLPGLVDTHVHVNEPGRTDWEGFASATRAAAAGGVTTLLDMPLNAIPATTNATALTIKRDAAAQQCHVDVGFIGGIVADNENDLAALREAGVFAWKCFLVDSGVPEFTAVDETVLRRVLPALAAWDLPLMVHAELPGPIARARPNGPVRQYSDYAATRPVQAEVDAVDLMIRLSDEYTAPVHIVHVSSADAAQRIAAARARGSRVTGETCPHYLTFDAAGIGERAAAYKCAPPIRSAAHRDALWRALVSGAIDMIVSDHSPALPSLKWSQDLMRAWGGIASLQVGLSAAWSGARQRGIALHHIADWMARAPADLVRLPRKGRIAPGCDADLVVFEPDTKWIVVAAQLQQRHAITPYHDLTLAGRVRATYLRGELIYDGAAFADPPRGRLLHRSEA